VKPYYSEDGITIFCADCRDILPSLPKVDVCLTDPPYGLEFMGKEWDHGVPGRETWEAVLRVLKPGAPLLAFGGTRTHHRLMCAIEDAGFEIRDCLMWLYGSGFPKSLDVSKAIDKAAGADREVVALKPHARPNSDGKSHGYSGKQQHDPFITAPATDAAKLWNGYGTALKPAWEPIILAMKSCDGTFAENALKWGVAGLNIEACRITATDSQLAEKYASVRNAPPRKNRIFGADAKPRSEGKLEPSPLGRWPANLLLDEESAELLDEQSGPRMHAAGFQTDGTHCPSLGSFGPVPNKAPGGMPSVRHGDSGGASRFFYTAKADSNERGTGNDHPTVKPLDLMAYLCKLLCPPSGGVLLDPFMGSGSTLISGRRFFQRCIGIDSDEHACAIAVDRLRQSVLDFDPTCGVARNWRGNAD